MAALHGRCFVTPRAWTETEIAASLADPTVCHVADGAGFALARVAVDEADLLTLAVDPPQQGLGHGRRLLAEIEAAAVQAGARRMVLEVSAENGAARALYAKAGYEQVGQRPRYYRHPNGARVDALVLARSLG